MGWSGNGYPFTAARAVAVACGLLLGASTARAVTITNVTVAARDARTATVKFDVSWADSWRHEVNHDAAWVFFKARADDKSEWQHVRLAADKVLNPKGYAACYCMRYYLTHAQYAALMDTLTGEQAKARYNTHVVNPPPRYISRGAISRIGTDPPFLAA